MGCRIYLGHPRTYSIGILGLCENGELSSTNCDLTIFNELGCYCLLLEEFAHPNRSGNIHGIHSSHSSHTPLSHFIIVG